MAMNRLFNAYLSYKIQSLKLKKFEQIRVTVEEHCSTMPWRVLETVFRLTTFHVHKAVCLVFWIPCIFLLLEHVLLLKRRLFWGYVIERDRCIPSVLSRFYCATNWLKWVLVDCFSPFSPFKNFPLGPKSCPIKTMVSIHCKDYGQIAWNRCWNKWLYNIPVAHSGCAAGK